jgi:translation initiation factor IF-2
MDNFVIGSNFGRIKAMFNQSGKRIRSAEPSVPVLIAGLQDTPLAGDLLQVVAAEKLARLQASEIRLMQEQNRDQELSEGAQVLSRIQSGNLKTLKVIIKTDTKGSLEAIKASLAKIQSDEISLKVIHSDVANVSESDVTMAAAGGALIFAFHVHATVQAKKLAQQYGVEIRNSSVIYQLIDEIKGIMTGLLDPEKYEVILGKARVKAVFFKKRSEKIIGCGVENGLIANKSLVRVFRKDELVGEGRIDSLKRVDKVVDEIKEGNDCGIKFIGPVELEEGDILECYKTETRAKTLE